MDVWVDISGYGGKYQVSNLGFVRVNKNLKVMYQENNNKGYKRVKLSRGGSIEVLVHRLVAKHFLEFVDGKNQVNHIDFNKTNNRVENLEWCTNRENTMHYINHGKDE